MPCFCFAPSEEGQYTRPEPGLGIGFLRPGISRSSPFASPWNIIYYVAILIPRQVPQVTSAPAIGFKGTSIPQIVAILASLSPNVDAGSAGSLDEFPSTPAILSAKTRRGVLRLGRASRRTPADNVVRIIFGLTGVFLAIREFAFGVSLDLALSAGWQDALLRLLAVGIAAAWVAGVGVDV
jgi:hypothetical protein